MKVKKSKGFTLIELLAVIIILGIVVALASVGVSKSIKKSKEKLKVQAAEEIIAVAKAYMATNNVNLVSISTLLSEGYLSKNFTNPKTGKEYDESDNDFYIISCTNNECKKDDKVTDDGFSSDNSYLNFNEQLNSDIGENINNIKDSEDFSFNKDELIISAGNYTLTKDDIDTRIKKLYEDNKNKGVLVMSLAENEKVKLKEKSEFKNINNTYYLYYEGEILKSKKIDDTDVDRENMKYLGAKYIVDVIRKNNKNYEIIEPSNGGFRTLEDSKIKPLFNYEKIINPYEGCIGISTPYVIYIFYYTDSKGNYYQVNNYTFY